MQAATGGHVIIINVSQYGFDALIFDDIHQIERVPLLNTDLERLSKLADDIVLQRPINTSAAQCRRYTNRYLKPALQEIWNDILIPIFDKIQLPLNGNSDAPQCRIWWYPTGPLTFIPMHAAGPGSGEIDVSHLVISSYVTTLSSFVQAQEKTKHTSVGCLKLLALSLPEAPMQESILLALEEVDKVVQIVSSSGWPKEDIMHLSGSDATVDSISRALDSSSWVHFACHRMQHIPSGINSAFALRDGDLKLSQITSKDLSSGRFVFLSACHTAAGAPCLPGEAMHLAGGLQFAGFLSVIATMWGIRDEDAPIVARHTYEYLFCNGCKLVIFLKQQ
jgi:CHAT domain-containing protein